MNEPFDSELSRALKSGTDRSLEGWTFTPAMRDRVLERVREESGAEPETASESPSPRRFPTARALRPAAWVAVAAAVAVIAFSTDMVHLTGGVGSQKSTASAPAAKTADQASAQPAESSTAVRSASAPAAHLDSAPEGTKAQPGVMNATGKTGSEQPGTADSAPVFAAPVVVAFELTAPETLAAKALNDGQTQPAQAQGTAAPRLSLMAVPPQNLGMAVLENGPVLSLSAVGVRAVGRDGVSVWERPLADLGQQSIMAAAADGRVAVANGGSVLYLLSPQGDLERTVYGKAAITGLTWSADGRVAAVEGSRVEVYSVGTGKSDCVVETGPGAELAFAPDGTLAVYGARAGEPHALTMSDPAGALAWEARPSVTGAGLAFVAEGNVVVAGGQAYDRTGKSLWQVPLTTAGVTAMGPSLAALWDAHTVMMVDAHDGHAVWKAGWNGSGDGIRKVAPAPDGRFLAIVAPVDGGAVLWVVDSSGKLLWSEKLPEMPVDISVAGNQVVLLMPQGVQYRVIAQQ